MNGDSVFNGPSFEDTIKRPCTQVYIRQMEINLGVQDVDVNGVIRGCGLG